MIRPFTAWLGLALVASLTAGCSFNRGNGNGFSTPANDGRCWIAMGVIDDERVISSESRMWWTRVHEVYLTGQPVTDRIVPTLLRIRSLDTLDISGTDLSVDALRRLAAGLPALTTVFISTGRFAAADLDEVRSGHPSLTIAGNVQGEDYRQSIERRRQAPATRPGVHARAELAEVNSAAAAAAAARGRIAWSYGNRPVPCPF